MELNRRQRQLGEVLKQGIADFLSRTIDPNEFGLVTVIDVILSPNMAKVEVWLSCLGPRPSSLEAHLQRHVPALAQIVHQHLHLRRKIHLAFKIAG